MSEEQQELRYHVVVSYGVDGGDCWSYHSAEDAASKAEEFRQGSMYTVCMVIEGRIISEWR